MTLCLEDAQTKTRTKCTGLDDCQKHVPPAFHQKCLWHPRRLLQACTFVLSQAMKLPSFQKGLKAGIHAVFVSCFFWVRPNCSFSPLVDQTKIKAMSCDMWHRFVGPNPRFAACQRRRASFSTTLVHFKMKEFLKSS